MAKDRIIKKRIKGVKNIQEITRAMKLVAAARIKKAEDRVSASRPYTKKLAGLMNNLLSDGKDDNDEKCHDLMKIREVKKVLLVPVSGDKGLCGSFNNNIFRAAGELLRSFEDVEISVMPVGNKAYRFYSSRGFNIPFYYKELSDIDYSVCKEISGRVINMFLEEKFDELYFIYGQYVSTMVQNIITFRLLPFESEPEENGEIKNNRDYILEPSAGILLEYIIPKYVEVQIYQIMLETAASELGARLMAMTNATDNAEDLISALTLKFYRARQEAITTQILEITSGAEAIKG